MDVSTMKSIRDNAIGMQDSVREFNNWVGEMKVLDAKVTEQEKIYKDSLNSNKKLKVNSRLNNLDIILDIIYSRHMIVV